MSNGAERQHIPVGRPPRTAVLPTTRLGRWAVGLAAGFFVLTPAWTILPGGGALGLLSALAAGPVAAVAVIRDRERAILVFAAFLPFLLGLVFILGELLLGHD